MKKAQTYHSDIIDDLLNDADPRELRRIENRVMLAAKIADAMKDKGWRKIDLAAHMGCKPSQVTKWLSGTNNFTADVLSDLQDVLEIELLNVRNEEECATETRVYHVEVMSTLHFASRPLVIQTMQQPSYALRSVLSNDRIGWGGESSYIS